MSIWGSLIGGMVGFSLGALIARDFASRLNERLCSLIIHGSIYKRTEDQKRVVINRWNVAKLNRPASKKAAQTAKNTFEKKSIGDDLPSVKIEKEKLTNGINIIDLVIASNLSNSKSEVKRMIKNKGIKINNETVENDKLNVSLNNFNQNNI